MEKGSKMIGTIIKWFIHSRIFEILVAFVIDSVIFGEAMFTLSKVLFSIIKNNTYRICMCIGICILSAVFCYQYSKWGLLLALIVMLISAFITITEKEIMSKVDNVKFSINEKFKISSLEAWGSLSILALFGPVLLCLNVIVCKYFDVAVIGWFKFYWTFEEGLFQYGIIRYTIALAPWLILLLTFGSLNELRTNEWLIDLAEVRRKEILKERDEANRILQLNPDSDIALYNDVKEVNSGVEENNLNEVEDASESILDDISKFI